MLEWLRRAWAKVSQECRVQVSKISLIDNFVHVVQNVRLDTVRKFVRLVLEDTMVMLKSNNVVISSRCSIDVQGEFTLWIVGLASALEATRPISSDTILGERTELV